MIVVPILLELLEDPMIIIIQEILIVAIVAVHILLDLLEEAIQKVIHQIQEVHIIHVINQAIQNQKTMMKVNND
jgi:hypothetical protein